MKKNCSTTVSAPRLSIPVRNEDGNNVGSVVDCTGNLCPLSRLNFHFSCFSHFLAGTGSTTEDEAGAHPPESSHIERDGSLPVSDDEDAFTTSFSIPTPEAPFQAKKKREIIHPPSVATSKAFVEFMEAKEREKTAVQEAKDLKRKEREQKRAIKEAESVAKKQERDKKRTNKTAKKASNPKKRRN